jgi:hypothetical protein
MKHYKVGAKYITPELNVFLCIAASDDGHALLKSEVSDLVVIGYENDHNEFYKEIEKQYKLRMYANIYSEGASALYFSKEKALRWVSHKVIQIATPVEVTIPHSVYVCIQEKKEVLEQPE